MAAEAVQRPRILSILLLATQHSKFRIPTTILIYIFFSKIVPVALPIYFSGGAAPYQESK